MDRSFRLSTALDVDDLLLECVPYAIRLANEKYHFDPPLTIHEVDRWGKLGTRADVIFELMDNPDFFRNQPPIKGAKEFVCKLSQMTEVFVTTAVWPPYMTLRFQRILEEFPEIPQNHILIGSRKDKIDVDILFDDGLHNVVNSTAPYPILMRRPWNQEATGLLAVNNYDEFLKLVETIADGYSAKPKQLTLDEPGIVVLVGPSGSGKNKVACEMLRRCPRMEKLVSYTTDADVAALQNRNYHYVSEEDFRRMHDDGAFFESTTYAHHAYGSRKEDVERILGEGKHVLTVMDICGAMALKTLFPHVITIYIQRDKKELIKTILDSNSTTEDKANRLLFIEAESRNAQICDYTVQYDTPEQATEQILQSLQVKEVNM